MVDARVEKLAKLCVHYSVDVKSKEKVLIQGNVQAFPLMHEIYKECLLSDAYPFIMPQLDTTYTFFKYAKEHQLTYVSSFEKFLIENIDTRISVFCEPNPKRLTNIDPTRTRIFAAARNEISAIFYKRVAEGKLKWTALPYPINAQAQEAAMALEEYEDFVYNSCLVDKENPIAEWKKIYKQQEKICEFLNKASEIHVVGEDTDLTFNAKGRRWINCGGKENMPDGEVFTAPIENSVNGTIRFTFPGLVFGREVEDIKLTFKDGKVVKASAEKGDEFLQQVLKIEGAERIGEAAIGTNYAITKFTKNMLFDEKMGGTIHMALGNSYPESGGVNKSPIHWDILKDMKKGGEIYADDKLFYKDGKFLI
ncbi:MAG: aminopeptidase [Candidatus Bathyarchaeota archaeon]|jgi:aminopeptidase|nr:aminopeptidase [Candidatus Bathyarchaeota archaeon A05DMB-5]MDH7558269.1 aminopeptidase [Candidatus Bathyarchaeota archaeon]